MKFNRLDLFALVNEAFITDLSHFFQFSRFLTIPEPRVSLHGLVGTWRPIKL